MKAKKFSYISAGVALMSVTAIATFHLSIPDTNQYQAPVHHNDRATSVPRANASSAAESAIARLDAKLQKLEQTNSELEKKLKEVSSNSVQADAEPVSLSESKKGSRSAERQVVDAQYFQSRMENEFVDFEWAGTAEKKILDLVEDEFSNSSDLSLKNVQCHMTMCKVEVTIKEESKIQESLVKFNENLGWDATIYTEFDVLESGEVVAQSFIMREGHNPTELAETR